MSDLRLSQLLATAASGRLDRRQALSLGLKLGLTSPAISALLAMAPAASAATPRPMSTARAPQMQQAGGTLTIVSTSGFSDLDPQNAYDNRSSMLFLAAYEMLIQLRGPSTDEYDPMLAQSWEVSDDQATYTFALAPDAMFHDGTPCDAQAVKDSFIRFLEMGGGPVNVISRFVQDPDQMEVVDVATIRFNLGRPQPLFLPAMASEYGPFVVNPRQIAENSTDDDPFGSEWLQFNMAGSGPYALTEYLPNERVVFDRFPDYHMGWDDNHFERIVVRIVPENATRRQLIESGEIDGLTYPSLTADDLAAMEGNPDLQIFTYDTTNVEWVIMNTPRLLTPDVRRGFCYAFPYQEVIDGAFKGLLTLTSGPIADSIRGYDPDGFIYSTDLDQAKELILSGGFVEGDVFEYLVPGDDEIAVVVAQLFQANLQQIGFVLDIVEVDSATRTQIVYGDSPAEERPHFVGGWGWWPDYNDPWNQLAPNFLESAINGGANGGYWVNERFEEIMAEAEHYTDEDRLVELMREAQNILTEQDPPAIFYGQLQWYTVVRSDIRGFHHNPLYLGSFPFRQMWREPED